MSLSLKRVKRDAIEWAIITHKGTISKYPFAHYDNDKRDWGERREKAFDAAFKHYQRWLNQACVNEQGLALIER